MSSKRKPPFRGDPLPRGRHGLSSELVRASQRERVIKAMLGLVAEHGYAKTTVPAVIAAARCSRNAFYEFFPDKEACFLAGCEEVAADVYATMETFGVEDDWIAGVWRGIHTFLRWWQEHPGLARAWLVEMPLVGQQAADQRERVYALFEELFRQMGKRIRREHAGLPTLPDFVPRFLVTGLIERVATEVRTHGTGHLLALAPGGLFIIVKLLADDATAQAALARYV